RRRLEAFIHHGRHQAYIGLVEIASQCKLSEVLSVTSVHLGGCRHQLGELHCAVELLQTAGKSVRARSLHSTTIVLGAHSTHGIVVFEGKSQRVDEGAMTGGTRGTFSLGELSYALAVRLTRFERGELRQFTGGCNQIDAEHALVEIYTSMNRIRLGVGAVVSQEANASEQAGPLWAKIDLGEFVLGRCLQPVQ